MKKIEKNMLNLIGSFKKNKFSKLDELFIHSQILCLLINKEFIFLII